MNNIDHRSDPTKDLVFVIGDPQGQTHLLEDMLERIQTNLTGWPLASNDKIVIMGNFIHSSGDTLKVTTLLRKLKDLHGDNLVIIRGAKEHLLCKNRQSFYKSDLGRSVVNSYRIGRSEYVSDKTGLNVSMMLADISWLNKNTSKFLETNKFFICSSGIDVNKPLDEQYLNSLMFLREPFLNTNKSFGKVVVHGTTPSLKVDIKSNRINVNSEPYKTKTLSCTILDDSTGEVEDVYTLTKR